MSFEVTRQQAIKAAEQFLIGMAAYLSYFYSPAKAMQLVDMTAKEFEAIERLEDRSTAANQLDMEQFELIRMISRLADYAWEGFWYGNEVSLEETLTEASTVEPLLSKSLRDPFGEDVIAPDAARSLSLVLLAANGRNEVDNHDALGLDQLAALAGVSDKTIRMAANPKLDNHLKTEKHGQRTIVNSEDALEWLMRRPSFKPTRMNAGIAGQEQISDAKSLANVCVRFREKAGLSLKDLRTGLKWSAADALAYQNMERGEFTADEAVFDAGRLVQLAAHLKLPDKEQFARDAIRVVYQGRAIAMINAELKRIGQ